MSFHGPGTEAPRRADFEASTPQPIPTLESVGSSPLRFGSPSQFHRLHTAQPRQHRDADTSMLRPRFIPLQRFAGREEPHNSSRIPSHRLGCVPRVSHPLDALLPPRPAGLVSSRFRSWGSPSRLVPTRCRTLSRAPDPSGFWRCPSGHRLPLRDRAHRADPARRPGV